MSDHKIIAIGLGFSLGLLAIAQALKLLALLGVGE